MAENNQNDIIISAKANTQQAEANLQKLDAQVQKLAKGSTPLDNFNNSLKKVEKSTTGLSSQQISVGFDALQGNLSGVIKKLGEVGLAVAGIVGSVKLLLSIQNEWNKSLKEAADSTAALAKQQRTEVDAVNNRAQTLMNGIKELNDLAATGDISSDQIKTLTAMVDEYQKTWGNVGMSVDQVTGKVNGLEGAERRLKFSLHARELTQLNKEVNAALDQKVAADTVYSSFINEDGSLTLAGKAQMFSDAGIVGSAAAAFDESGATYQNMVKAFVNKQLQQKNAAGAALAEARRRLDRYKAGTRDSDITGAVDAAKATRGSREAAQAAAEQQAAEQAALAANVDSWNNNYNANYAALQQQLVNAILNGKPEDVEQARTAIADYEQSQYRTLLQQTQEQLTQAQATLAEAKAKGDIAKQAETQQLIDTLTKQIQTTAAKIVVDPVFVEETMEVAEEINRSTKTNGTFDAYGLRGLTQNTVEQQQLEVQKQIAKNTEQLNVPVVGE